MASEKLKRVWDDYRKGASKVRAGADKAARSQPVTILAGAAFLLAVGCAALIYTPQDWFWTFVVDPFWLYALWPVVLAVFTLVYCVTGDLSHSLTGKGVYAPFWAFVACLVYGISWVLLIDAWAADRGLVWCGIVLASLAVLTFALFRSTYAYTGSWLFLNSSLIRAVRRSVASGKMEQIVEAQRKSAPGKRWGSLHCLRILEGDYRIARAATLRDLEATDNFVLSRYVASGHCLIAYLLLDWPEGVLKTEVSESIAEVRREMITICLWFRRLDVVDDTEIAVWMSPGVAPRGEPVVGVTPKGDQAGPSLFEHKQQGSHRDFLELCFRLALGSEFRVTGTGQKYDLSKVESDPLILRKMTQAFEELAGPHRDIGLATWLAVSDRLPSRLRLDFWLTHRRGQGKPGLPVAFVGASEDCSMVMARHSLAGLYEDILPSIAPDWSGSLAARGRSAEASRRGLHLQVAETLWEVGHEKRSTARRLKARSDSGGRAGMSEFLDSEVRRGH